MPKSLVTGQLSRDVFVRRPEPRIAKKTSLRCSCLIIFEVIYFVSSISLQRETMSGNKDTLTVCHKPGRSAGVRYVHGSGGACRNGVELQSGGGHGDGVAYVQTKPLPQSGERVGREEKAGYYQSLSSQKP